MSIRVLSAVLDRYPVGGSEKLVLVTLADWCDDEGLNLHPSIAAVAHKACCSESQARRIIHKMIDGGILSVVGNENGGAPGSTRRYRLNVEAIEAMPKLHTNDGSHQCKGSRSREGSHPCARRVAPMRETGSTDASLTVIEPSDKPSEKKAPKKREKVYLENPPAPPNVSPESWAGFMAARKAKRCPMTQRALDLITKSLSRLTPEAANACVDKSAVNGWTDVYPERFLTHGTTAQNHTTGRPQGFTAGDEAGRRWLASKQQQ